MPVYIYTSLEDPLASGGGDGRGVFVPLLSGRRG
jgi:hypothetical protein